jgi:beta-glucosidase
MIMSESGPLATVTATQIEDLLGRMTLEEKAALTVGRDLWSTTPIARLGIPSVWLSDGPTGLRKAPSGTEIGLATSLPATCFPTESALGASWDVDLVREIGQAIATEAQAAGVQVVLGPGANLKRSPLCGRNFEYFSEDPVLTGRLAAAFVTGLQERGVGASVKHLVANESETGRMLTDSVVDERTLREVYLRPFEIVVDTADPWTLMAAYNRLNGIYCTLHRRLLQDIVVGEWGYRGIIVSDWLAVNDPVAAVAAGLHLTMPHVPTAASIVAAVREGRLAEARLDAVVRPLLSFLLRADAARRPDSTVDLDAHHQLARRAAAAGAVLLKHEDALLPLEGADLADVALLGAFATQPRYQGAGSSQVVPARPVTTIQEALERQIGPAGRVRYAPGYEADGAVMPQLIEAAQDAARQAQVAVVVVGLPASYEEEGADRPHLDLPPGHNALVTAVLAVQPRTVVILINGSAVALPWAAQAPAILEGWLGGQAGGEALVDVLLGQVNPGGKLAETFPARLEDTPAYLNFPDDGTGRVPFGEGLFTGYRWYDARRIEPLFPFGHGLSYTTFAYSDLAVAQVAAADGPVLTVSLRLKNTGARTGSEVVQVYVRERQPRLQRPEKELRAFARIALDPGEERAIHFTLGARDLAVYDPRSGAWTISSATFDLLVGASSRDIRLHAGVVLEGIEAPRVPRDRFTPMRVWLADPDSRAALWPAFTALRQVFLGSDVEPAVAVHEQHDLLHSFLEGMPIAKLVVFGVLSEQALTEILARANAAGAER